MRQFNNKQTCRKHGYKTALAIALAAGSLVAAATPADAVRPARLKEMSFSTQPVYNQVIRVTSSDNKTWDSITPGSLSFGAHVMIDTSSWTKYVAIVLGYCYGGHCLNRPALWYDNPFSRDYENQMAVTFSTNRIPLTGANAAAVPLGGEIIDQCNEKVTMNGGEAHGFDKIVPMTFVANSEFSVIKPVDGSGRVPSGPPEVWNKQTDHSRYGAVKMRVECEPFERERAEDVEDINIVAKKIELRVVAPAGPTTKPNMSTVCRKAKLTVRMETNRVGPVRYRLWSQAGDAPMTSKAIDMWASEVAPGNIFVAEHSEWVTVTKTSTVQAMAEDLTNAIGQSTGWKDALVRCEPTSGGFADAPRPGTNEPVFHPLEVSGELKLTDQAGAPKDKPRIGKAAFRIWATKPGSTSYRLTCSGGRQWEGTLSTSKVANKKYQAVGSHGIRIAKTERISCSLKSLAKPGNPLLALATKMFVLQKVWPGTSGGGKTTGKPNAPHGRPSGNRPDKRPPVIVTPKPPKRPKKPSIKVAPKPKLVCINGKVSRNTCFCPGRTVKKRVGANAFRCDRAVANPNRVIPTAPPKRLKPKAPPKRIITRAPPKRIAPKRTRPKRVKPKRRAPSAAPAARNLRLRAR